MPTYKLTYFNVRARGETARMLFKLADQPFEDIRIDSISPELKKQLPMGQTPLLEIDDAQLVQGNTINRYLAKKFGFSGSSDWETARVDMVGDCVEDLTPRVLALYDLKGQDEAYAKYAERYRTEFLIPTLTKLEKLLENNNGGDGFFVGNSVTWADLAFVNISEYVIYMGKKVDGLDQFPKLKALQERVLALSKIAAWVKERPVTAF